jgi:hypothetical protein
MASERTRNLYDHKSSRKGMREPHERERGGGDASMSHRGTMREAARTAGRGQDFREHDYGTGYPQGHHETHERHRRERHEMHQRHHTEREHVHQQQSVEHANMAERHSDEHSAIRERHELEMRQDQSGEGGAGMGPLRH